MLVHLWTATVTILPIEFKMSVAMGMAFDKRAASLVCAICTIFLVERGSCARALQIVTRQNISDDRDKVVDGNSLFLVKKY